MGTIAHTDLQWQQKRLMMPPKKAAVMLILQKNLFISTKENFHCIER